MNPTLPTAAVPAPQTTPTPADQYAALKSAVLGAQVNTAPGASPLGSFPELDKLTSSAPILAKQQLDSAGPNYNSAVDDANQRAAAEAARTAAAQKLKDLQDPGKYKQVQKPDGGYAFYDPLGNEISASDFASVHNTTPNEVLKHSQNPIDISYQQDFNNLQSYINAKLRPNDPKSAGVVENIEQSVPGISKMSPAQLIQEFKTAYPTIYGGKNKGVPANTTLIPNGNDIPGGA